jgi:hypothetical protein
MSKIFRVAALTVALFAVAASSASAVTWHNSGATSFTGTGTATQFDFGGQVLPCTGPAVTGTAGSGPFSGATWTNAATLNVSYSHCTQAGVPFNVQCSLSDSFTTQTGAVTSGSASASCDFNLFTTKVCGATATIPTTYTNPSGSTPGAFTLSQATLTLSNGPQGTCPFGNGPAGTFTHQTITLSSAAGSPVITRTP